MQAKCVKLLCVFIILFNWSASGQDWRFQVGDQWFNDHQGLKVGDTMPDIPLGNIVNNYTGKKRFSDFRGKLVILDMWNTTCKTCIAKFPHMEALQKEFGDKIQIFIVNPYQTQKQIDIAWQTYEPVKNKKLPNLPSITAPTMLSRLFPARFVPHHVWIDEKGIIRLIGDARNTYAAKIEEILSGKEIGFMNSSNNTPLFNKKFPYYKVLGRQVRPGEINTFFTPFNNDYQVTGGSKIENEYDSSIHSIRNTYVNNTIFDLFLWAYYKDLKEDINRIIFAANATTYAQIFVKDSSLFFSDDSKSEKEFMRKRYSYELITPSSFSEDERKKRMQEDLNKEFGNLLKFRASVEDRKIECYVIIAKNGTNKLSSKETEIKMESYAENGIKMDKYSGAPFPSILRDILGPPFIQNLQGKSFVLLDETGYEGKVDLILPDRNEIKTLNDFRMALQKNNLDIIKAERNINSLVIRQK